VTARVYASPNRADLDVDALQDELLATVDVAAGSTSLSAAVDAVVPLFPFGREQLAVEARALLELLRTELAVRFGRGAGVGWEAGVVALLLEKLAWEGDGALPARQLARYGLQTLTTKFNTLVNGPVRRHVDGARRRACGAEGGDAGASGRLTTSIHVVVAHTDGSSRLAIVDSAQRPPPGGELDEGVARWWSDLGSTSAEEPTVECDNDV